MNVRTWVEQALSKTGIAVAPLTPEIMIESVHLPGEMHGDPADRMLTATARVLGATLLTKDERLIQYSKLRHVRALEA
jgi:PIN domain nuclease of toxin-antitoxin system